MIHIAFEQPAGDFDVRGPFRRLHIDGKLLMDFGGNVIATYRHGQWFAGEDIFTRFEIKSKVRLRLADNGHRRTIGPLDELQFIDGAIRGDESLAHFNEAAGKWLTFDDQGRWASIVIEPV